jgi:tetratricopeptide (TPR) repeat protein
MAGTADTSIPANGEAGRSTDMTHTRNPITIGPVALALALSLWVAGSAPVEAGSPAPDGTPPGPATTTNSPAEEQIGRARTVIASRPTVAAYNALAIGHVRRARETGDVSHYHGALAALEESRRLDPADPEALLISAWARMGRHEFDLARRLARRYLAERPDDTRGLAVLADSLLELGEYEDAERVLDRLIDIRPGPASFGRIAYFREITGDPDGALDLMRLALAAASRDEPEDRAWFKVQVGHLQEATGDLPAAEEGYRAALRLFPGYHYALAALSGITLRAGRPEEALSFARQAIEAAPHAERYLVLADALRALGRKAEAQAAEDRFEAQAIRNSDGADNENHDLVLFYLDRRPDPARALALARHEAKARRDIHTLDRLAWALHRNGKSRAAERLMMKILATGTRDPLIRGHAERILAAP